MGKGQEFERNIPRYFSTWWSYGKDKDIFRRTGGSGSSIIPEEFGDMTYRKATGELLLRCFIFELKKGYTKNTDILDLLNPRRKNPILFDWWKKLEGERIIAERPHKALVLQRDRKNPLIFLEPSFIIKQEAWGGELNCFVLDGKSINEKENFCVMALKDFFIWTKPEDIEYLVGRDDLGC